MICARTAALLLLIQSKPFKLELDGWNKSTSVNIFGLLKSLCSSLPHQCSAHIPPLHLGNRSGLCLTWPLFDQQILEGWARTTGKVPPYSYYSYYLPYSYYQSRALWAESTPTSTNIHAGKQEAKHLFYEKGLCIASTSLLVHTPEHIPPGNRNIWTFSPGWIDIKSFSGYWQN